MLEKTESIIHSRRDYIEKKMSEMDPEAIKKLRSRRNRFIENLEKKE